MATDYNQDMHIISQHKRVHKSVPWTIIIILFYLFFQIKNEHSVDAE